MIMSTQAGINLKLKTLRKREQITQKQLADALGIAQTTIANYESGTRFPDERNLIKLSDYFGISIDSLMNRKPQNPERKEQKEFHYSPSELKTLVDDYIERSLRSESDGTDFIFSLLNSGYTEEQISIDLLEAALVKAGQLWSDGSFNEAMEHQLSMTVIQSIMLMKAENGAVTPYRGKAVALTADGEMHNIGLKMICRFMEIDGWDCYYLGSSVPPNSLRTFMDSKSANLLMISFTMEESIDSVCSLIEYIKRSESPPAIAVGGQGSNPHKKILQMSGADFTGSSASEIISWTRNI